MEKLKHNTWENETVQYGDKVRNLVQNSSQYSMEEFHISGQNVAVLTGALQGGINPTKVEVYYENNQPKKIHALYDGQGTGQNIDVYISGKALQEILG